MYSKQSRVNFCLPQPLIGPLQTKLDCQRQQTQPLNEHYRMRVVLKRDKKMANPTSESTAIASRVRRKIRAHRREVNQAIVKNNGDKTCSICIDEIDGVFDTVVTSCSHLFHEACFHEYKKQKAMAEIEEIHSLSLYDSDEAHWDVGKQMIKVLIGYDTGFACPNCRCKAPFIHKLAKRTAAKARAFQLGCVTLELSSTDVLDLATRRSTMPV